MRGKGRKRQCQTTSRETGVPQKSWVVGRWGVGVGRGPHPRAGPAPAPGEPQGSRASLGPSRHSASYFAINNRVTKHQTLAHLG